MQAAKKAPKGADGFFKEGGAKEELSATRKADQKTVDTVVCALSPQIAPGMECPRHDVGACRYVLQYICTWCCSDGTLLGTLSLASCSCTRALSVDYEQLLATIKKTEFLKAYLNARFSLSKGDAPHAMKF